MSRSLDQRAVQLLLEGIESREMCLSAYTLELFPEPAERLLSWHLIRPKGYESVTAMPGDIPVTLQWCPSTGAHGYFDETAGWVSVKPEELSRHYVDVSRFFHALTGTLTMSGHPTERVPNHLWHLGSVKIPAKDIKAAIWFGRRLIDRTVLAEARQWFLGSPTSEMNILLVSTNAGRLDLNLPRVTIVSITDVISSDRLAIDPLRLAASLACSQTNAGTELEVFAGGREVKFRGRLFRFKGLKQQEIISFLHQKYLEGDRWVSSAEILEALSFHSTKRIRDVFKKNEAWGQLLTERDGMCGFRLD